jgi:shikimate dehydrogenase
MVYTPEPTVLLDQARKRGLAAADGLGMLAAQGEAAFALWFSQAPEPLVMRRALDASDEI